MKMTLTGDSKSGGYIVEYRELSDYPSPQLSSSPPSVELYGFEQNKVILEDLAIGKSYEIVVIATNSQGKGPRSAPEAVYVGEAVPTGAPRNLEAAAVSPTEVGFFLTES